MDIYVLNSEFEEIGVIDVFQSLIWTTRYYDVGDFELYLPATKQALELLTAGNYLKRDDSARVMIIEKLQVTTDAEEGNYITASGRSFESALTRRIILSQINYSGALEGFIYTIINDNAITAANVTARKIPNLALSLPPLDTGVTLTAQVTYDEVAAKITELCKTYGIGWKIEKHNKTFYFSLYKGADRSYNQSENPFVVFSPEYDNLINSAYNFDKTNYKNAALVAGEGEGTARQTWGINSKSAGLERYELFVDAKDISSNEGAIETSEYYSLLDNKGATALAERAPTYDFDGEIEPSYPYIFGVDYKLGDIVQIDNELGITAAARIVEIIENWGTGGYKIVPTFEEWEVN